MVDSTLNAASDEARVSRVIFDYASKIGRAADTDSTLQLNAAMARDLVGADRCSIWLIDSRSNQLWTKVAHGVDEIRIPVGEGIIGACIQENRLILVNDTSADARFRQVVDRRTGYETRSVLAIPLHGSDGQVIGALQVLNKPDGFDVQDANLLGLAGAYSASAIEAQILRRQVEATRLLQRELEIARGVQERLFPQLPVYPELDCAALCRPARAVGGDYFDFIDVPGGAGLLFTLGDVSGKGVGAAVLMASIQASIRSQALRPPESLARLVEDFNRAIFSFTKGEKYSTLFCGLLSNGMSRLTYVNAAQVPPVVVRVNGAIELLEEGGMPVGMFPSAEYKQGTASLDPGDAIICFSDGISEATNSRDEMWDPDSCLQLLKESARLRAQAIVDTLVAGADDFTGEAEQADDMTVVALKAVSP